ncbi:serine/threonine-protein kinase phg2 [Calliphora vicina]|uniref:serine/threonine-protein kinase phg2 n=1 Tax=Calliphora vicina TaxID=7373 RepID=UPI00325B8A97
MFEKRSIWGLIVGLNVCILIWLISVQEPVMFDSNTAVISSGSSNNFIIKANTGGGGAAVAAALVAQQQVSAGGGSGGWGRDLLSKHMPAAQSNEYVDEMTGSASTLTTLNISNNQNQNHNSNNNNTNNYNNNNLTATTKQTYDVKTTTKTSDLSADMQSLTSSLGTGVLDFKIKPTPSWATLTAVSSALPHEDFNQLIDLHNFQFLMPQPVCGNHIEALILIHSAPKNYEKRQVIRETWGSISHHTAESPLRVLFLLGAVASQQVQEDLQQENNMYRDIIQGSFIDDYRNMTYKHIMAFKWFLYSCPQAQILIKVDDDVYVNTPQLIKYLKEQQQQQQQQLKEMYNNDKPTIATTVTTPNTTNNTTTKSSIFHKLNIFASETPSTPASSSSAFNASQELFNHPQNLLFCQKIIGSLVKRSYRSKWRVSFKEYSERYYPPYCPGYAIIYSPDTIFRLYSAAQNSKYFWIDDVHITGVLAQQTNTTITTSSHYVLYSDECDQILTGKTDLSKTEFLFAWHSISAQKIKLLWHLQMMAIHTLDDLHYSKQQMMNDDDVYKLQRQPGNENDNDDVDNDLVDNNGISSSYMYTSANGFR